MAHDLFVRVTRGADLVATGQRTWFLLDFGAELENWLALCWIPHMFTVSFRNLAFAANNGLPADLYSEQGGSPRDREHGSGCLRDDVWDDVCMVFQWFFMFSEPFG